MPVKKPKCWTKPRIPKSKGGAGGTYTTCEDGQKKKKREKIAKNKKPIKKKLVVPKHQMKLPKNKATWGYDEYWKHLLNTGEANEPGWEKLIPDHLWDLDDW
tara:strand:- start:590 stop:895 length:306 start_codon:yes stop_codon:yes gene_type:complete